MAANNPPVPHNPLPLPFRNRFVPPLKFVPDEGFLLLLKRVGIQDPNKFISDFVHSAVELIKTRCLSHQCQFDGKCEPCCHTGHLNEYLDCLKRLFGHRNPKRLIFATTAANQHAFAQELNVPVLWVDQNGNLHFQEANEERIDVDEEMLRAERQMMKNRKKGVKYLQRHV